MVTSGRAPHGIARGLLVGWVVVVAAGFAVELAHAATHEWPVEVLVGLLSLSYEQNLPTWYGTCLLFAASLVLAEVAAPAWQRADPWRWHWIGLVVGFGYMSLDEAAELHENLGGLFGGSGLLYFDWVVPAAVLVAAIGLLYARFLLSLPATTRRRFVIAGAVYLTGALALELPLGWWTERSGAYNLTYALIDLAEEALELAGVSLFIVAVRDYSRRPKVDS